MRELGKLPDLSRARAFAGYLQSLSIETKLDEASDGCTVWVIEEDKVAKAREEFEQYRKNPDDERFRQTAPRLPDPERMVTAPVVRRRTRSSSEGFIALPSESRLTLALILASVVISLMYGNIEQKSFVRSHLFMREMFTRDGNVYTLVTIKPLPEVQDEGQVWRLVTPIFIHMDAMHLLFNMFWLYALGGQIERQRGPLLYGLLVLMLAMFSNLGQFFFSQVTLQDWKLVFPEPSPAFGGMSGVVYGLFGFIWMKMVYQPGCGLFLRPLDIFIMMLWFLLCFTGEVGPVANTAHMVGLVLGMICGYLGAWWSGWGQRETAV